MNSEKPKKLTFSQEQEIWRTLLERVHGRCWSQAQFLLDYELIKDKQPLAYVRRRGDQRIGYMHYRGPLAACASRFYWSFIPMSRKDIQSALRIGLFPEGTAELELDS